MVNNSETYFRISTSRFGLKFSSSGEVLLNGNYRLQGQLIDQEDYNGTVSRLQYSLSRGGLENCKIIVSDEVASDQQTQKVNDRTESG